MQRAMTLLFCMLLLAATGYVFAHARLKLAAETKAAQAQALIPPAPTSTASAANTSVGRTADAGAPEPPAQSELEKVLSGGAVPPLPNNAPSSVTLGVILFTHEDGQFPPKHARSKKEAQRLAKELLPLAEENFKEAVKKGDPGSIENAGAFPRDVLEPALQYVAYTLEKGRVFNEPLDTPRGYWIIKRLR
jgi:hypothetical protein